MLTEIEVEGVGIMRCLNDWQYMRLRKVRGKNREIAHLAFGLGMTFHQFRSLSQEHKDAAKEAFDRLTEPPPMRRGNRVVGMEFLS